MILPPSIQARTSLGQWLDDFGRCLRERTPLSGRNFRVREHSHGFTVAWTPPKKSASEQTVEVKQFKLFAVGGDVIFCRPLNADNEVTGTNWPTQIAKPYFLRATPFNQRTFPDGAGTISYVYAPTEQPPPSAQVRRVSRSQGGTFTVYQAVIPRYTVIIHTTDPGGQPTEAFSDSDPTLFPEKIAYSDVIYAARIYTGSKVPLNKTTDPGFEEDDDYTIAGDPEFGGVYWQDLNVDARHWAQI